MLARLVWFLGMLNLGMLDKQDPLSSFPTHQIWTDDSTYQEGDETDFQMVTVASVDGLAIYCIVQYLKKNQPGHLHLGALGEFLKKRFPSQLYSELGKMRPLVESHPDELCYSTTTERVSLRRGWPFPSLPDLTDEGGVDYVCPTVVDEDLERTPVNLLREAASRYLEQRLNFKALQLRAKVDVFDQELLVKRINQSVCDHGILRIEVLLAEIDEACHIRGVSEDAGCQEDFVFFFLDAANHPLQCKTTLRVIKW